MKKRIGLIILFLALILIFAQATLSAQEEKTITVYAGVGYAFSQYEGLLGGIALEMQFAQHFFAQFAVDYYLNPLPDAEDLYQAQYTLVGLNVEVIYKIAPSDSLNIFIKGGGFTAALREKIVFEGLPFSSSETRLGVGGGIGFEYALNEKFGLLVGGDVKYLMDKPTAHWYKIYGGMTYRLK